MMASTHMVGGALGGLIWCAVTPPQSIPEATVMVAGPVVGSLLPDLDHAKSKITTSNIVCRGISMLITIPPWGKHRRFWHSLWACIIFGMVGMFLTGLFSEGITTLFNHLGGKISFDISQYSLLVGIAFAWGALWHDLFDACTIEGWRVFYPLKFRLCFMPIHTSSPLETLFRIAATVIVVGLTGLLMAKGVFGDIPIEKIPLKL